METEAPGADLGPSCLCPSQLVTSPGTGGRLVEDPDMQRVGLVPETLPLLLMLTGVVGNGQGYRGRAPLAGEGT